MFKSPRQARPQLLPETQPPGYLGPLLCSHGLAHTAALLAIAFLISACTHMNTNEIPPAPQSSLSPAPAPQPRQTELRFVVAGDIMVHQTQLESAYDEECGCYDFKPTFASAVPLFKGADVAIANLETTLPGKNYSGYPAFGAPDSLVDAVKSAGINLLTTANNHCLDKGKAAVIRTLQVLDEKGIPHLGTYASDKDYEKRRIFLLTQNGMTVAMLNYTYGTNEIPTPQGVVVNRINREQISRDIALAREQHVDAVIVLFHFGQEYLNQPDTFQRETVAHALASGADIVLGGHPHHVQPYELLQHADQSGKKTQRLVAYSLGNFVSSQRERYTDGGMVLYFTLVKKQDAAGNTTLDITDVHHKLVWIYIAHHGDQRQYHILPIETYLAPQNDIKLTPKALTDMQRYRADVEEVLGIKEGAVQK